jgi:sugar lactone lactonase YvrE
MMARVLGRRRSTLGESPRWDDSSERLWWLDIDEGLLCSIGLDGDNERADSVGRLAGALVLSTDAGLMLAIDDCWYQVSADGTRNSVASLRQPHMRFNDAGVDASGRVWSATMRRDEELGPPAMGGLFRLEATELSLQHSGLFAGNGIAWAPDDRTMYLVDSGAGAVFRWHFDEEFGLVGEPQAWLAPSLGIPDGMAVDAEGGVWIALWGTGLVVRYGVDGRETHRVEVPASQVTAVGFAGPGLGTMVVTTASQGLDSVSAPLAGALFATAAPIPGLALHRFH